MRTKKALLVLATLAFTSTGCEMLQSFTPHDDECHFNQDLELDCSDDDQPPLKDN